jgi:hypothetical protein
MCDRLKDKDVISPKDKDVISPKDKDVISPKIKMSSLQR